MSEWVTIKTGTETRVLNLACVRRVDFDDTGAALLHLVGEDPHVKHRLVGEAAARLRAYLADPPTAGRHVAGPPPTP